MYSVAIIYSCIQVEGLLHLYSNPLPGTLWDWKYVFKNVRNKWTIL